MRNLLSLLLIFFIACSGNAQHAVDANSFEKGLTGNKVQLLDVRTPEEHKKGHIDNSLLADWMDKKEFARRTQYLDKSTPVYIYCASGGRSAAAAKRLREEGYTVTELQGGFTAWRSADKPFKATTVTKEVSLSEYQGLIHSKEVVLVDFGAPWCPPCKKMEPVIAQLEKEHGTSVLVSRMNADETTSIMKELKVESLPTFILYKNGKETWRKQGLVTMEEFKAQLK